MDVVIYDTILVRLWGARTTRRMYPDTPLSPNVNLYFQQLFQNLLSKTGVEYVPAKGSYGERLSVIQSRYAENNPPPSGSEISNNPGSQTTSSSLDRNSMVDKGRPNRPDRSSMIDKGNTNLPDPQVLMLAATVIFSAVIAIMLSEIYFPAKSLTIN